MERRQFFSLLGAAAAVPFFPGAKGAARAAAGYNRYMYGLAVFQARTRTTLTAADLMGKLRVSATTAEAMMGEMQAKGVLVPALNGAAGTMRAASPNGQTGHSFGKITRKLADHVLDRDDVSPIDQDESEDRPRYSKLSNDTSPSQT